MFKKCICLLWFFSLFNFVYAEVVYRSGTSADIVAVSESDRSGVTVEFTLSEVRVAEAAVRDFGAGVRFVIDNKLSVPAPIGAPDVQRVRTRVHIPDKGAVSLEILEAQTEELGAYTVAPYQRPPKISGESFPYAINEDIYSTDALYPNACAQIITCEIIGDIRVAHLIINPVMVNPVTNEVTIVTNALVKIHYTTTRGENELNSIDKVPSRSFVPIYKNMLNVAPEYLHALDRQDNVPRYVFLGNDQTLAAVQDFINWKIRKGLDVHVANVDTVGSNSSTIDSWIESIYNSWSPKPEFIFFIGDENVIPPASLNNYECDNKFGVIGSGDIPSIHFGRITPKNNDNSNLTYQTWRIQKYETEPPDGTWLSRADAFGCRDNTGPQAAAKMVATFESAGLTAKSYVEGTSSLITGQALLDVFNEGLALFSMTGHGSQTRWVTANIRTTDIQSMTNGMKLPFITNVACLNSNFSNRYCFAESWMCEGSESDPKGCVAMVSSAPSATTGALPMLQGIMDGLCKEGIRHAGAALTYGKTLCSSSFNINGFIFWGDPEFDVTFSPDGLSELTARHQPPRPGNWSITVEVDGSPVQGALVGVVTGKYESLGSGYTDASGELTLNLPQFRDSSFVTVTYHNCPAYMKTCPPAGAFLFEKPAPNALFDVGETIELVWKTDGDPVDKVKIEYTRDNGQTYETIEASVDNSGSYEWTAPKIGSDECFFRMTDVSDPTRYSTSNGFRVWDVSGVSGEVTGASNLEVHFVGTSVGSLALASPGKYTLEKLYPGDYKIFALADIYSSDTVELTLPPDTTGIDLEILSPSIAVDPAVLSVKVSPESSKDFQLTVENTGKLLMELTAKSNNAARGVVINEIFSPKSAFIDGIELWNRGPDIDLTGWKVVWKDNNETSGEYAFQSGFTVTSGGTVVVMDDENSVNSNTFYMGVNAGWSCEDGTELSVALLNDQGKGVDFVRTEGNTDQPPAGTAWDGNGVPLKNDRIYRNSNADNDGAADWTGADGEQSINTINPGQTNGQMQPLWMMITPEQENIDPLTKKILTLTVDTKGLTEGNKYYDTLVVYHNAANKPSPLEIACELEVKKVVYPVAVDKTGETDQETAVTVTLEGTDSDGSIIGFRVADEPSHGTVELNAEKATYTPEKGFHGIDTLRYVAVDNDDLESEKAQVVITVKKITEIIPVDPVEEEPDLEFSVSPNPANTNRDGTVYFVVNAKDIAFAEITICDHQGNIIDEFEAYTPTNRFCWDLRNKQGKLVTNGMYLAVLRITNREGTVKVYRIKVGVQE